MKDLRKLYPDWKYWELDITDTYSRVDLLEIAIYFIKFYYEMYPTGGAYHIVLDDGNTDREFVKGCLDDFVGEDHLGIALGNLLLMLTDLELEILYDHYEEYSL